MVEGGDKVEGDDDSHGDEGYKVEEDVVLQEVSISWL